MEILPLWDIDYLSWLFLRNKDSGKTFDLPPYCLRDLRYRGPTGRELSPRWLKYNRN